MIRTARQQRGSMLVMGIGALVVAVLLLALATNLGFWTYKKTMVEDAAEGLARPVFRNQVVHGADPGHDPRVMVNAIAAELELNERLNGAAIEFVFSRGNEDDGWVSVGGNPDPTDEDEAFNRVQVLVCTPANDVTGLFTLPEPDGNERQICGLAEATLEEPPDCLCSGPLTSLVDGVVGGIRDLLCLVPFVCGVIKTLDPVLEAGVDTVCSLEDTLQTTVQFVAVLLRDASSADLKDVLKAVDCLLESVVVTVDTTLVTTLGENAIRIEYHRFTE